MRRRSAGSGTGMFSRTAAKTKAINLPTIIFRGGIRL